MTTYAIISGTAGTRTTQSVDMVTGPFDTQEEAEEFKALLERTTSGRHTVAPMHQPSKET